MGCRAHKPGLPTEGGIGALRGVVSALFRCLLLAVQRTLRCRSYAECFHFWSLVSFSGCSFCSCCRSDSKNAAASSSSLQFLRSATNC
jgi:hypothetical protein